MRRFAIFLFSCLGITYLCLSLYQFWLTNLPLVSPIDLIESLPPLAPVFKKPGAKIVFGFLPYWNMKDAEALTVKPLTHLAYFGIDLNDDGSLKTHDKPREKEPGWSKLNSADFVILNRQMKLLGKKMILVVRAMDNDQIETVLASTENRNRAIQTSLDAAKNFQFDGINVDFEYMGQPDQTMRDQFTQFVADLSSQCKSTIPNCQISLDILADSGIKNRLYDLSPLSKITDHIIVMAYDFYRPSSTQAGPIAPLRGKCSNPLAPDNSCLDYDVVTSIGDISRIVPAYKLILGVPFYGYAWQTANDQYLSHTYPETGVTAPYKKIQALFTDASISSLSAHWSSSSFSSYLSYVKDDKTYQVYYEDGNSLQMKIDFVHQAKLAGIGIWALGYEVPYSSLWLTIENSL